MINIKNIIIYNIINMSLYSINIQTIIIYNIIICITCITDQKKIERNFRQLWIGSQYYTSTCYKPYII